MKNCPKCNSEHIYEDRDLWVCPECAHEWNSSQVAAEEADASCVDANKQILNDGDSVVLIKDLKVKGASGALKKGTKVKSIRIIEPIDGHNISCKIGGFGALNLKSEFVKKV
jgi:protein PhnA